MSGINSLLDHYLYDFIFAGSKGTDQCKQLMHCFTDTCQELGVPIAHDKTVGPCTVLIFLGLIIDSEQMQIRIPEQKITELSKIPHTAQQNFEVERKDRKQDKTDNGMN